jgi:hypothetical protein
MGWSSVGPPDPHRRPSPRSPPLAATVPHPPPRRGGVYGWPGAQDRAPQWARRRVEVAQSDHPPVPEGREHRPRTAAAAVAVAVVVGRDDEALGVDQVPRADLLDGDPGKAIVGRERGWVGKGEGGGGQAEVRQAQARGEGGAGDDDGGYGDGRCGAEERHDENLYQDEPRGASPRSPILLARPKNNEVEGILKLLLPLVTSNKSYSYRIGRGLRPPKCPRRKSKSVE